MSQPEPYQLTKEEIRVSLMYANVLEGRGATKDADLIRAFAATIAERDAEIAELKARLVNWERGRERSKHRDLAELPGHECQCDGCRGVAEPTQPAEEVRDEA